jgi:redox-sensitive bicupin YhaK (pirin superfamily)
MTFRRILEVVLPQWVSEGAGVRLQRSMPSLSLDYLDPFLLFDHFGTDNPDDYLAGFPLHPHRGIETVTYMLAGSVNHRDSLGNSGSISAGDVQWMTAGGGILHEEMPKPVAGRMEGFQLWVNLPASNKMMPPRYQEVLSADIPEVKRGLGVRIRVVAGEVDGVRGPVTQIVANPLYLDMHLPARGRVIQPVPESHTVFAYLYAGEARFGQTSSEQGEFFNAPAMILLADGDTVRVDAPSNSAAHRRTHRPLRPICDEHPGRDPSGAG